MSMKSLLSSPAPISYYMKQLSEETKEDDKDSICVSSYFDDDEDLEDPNLGLPIYVFQKWRKAALIVCGLSIGFEFVLGFTSLVLSIIYQSPGTFGMAIDSVADIATTMVVLWRFSGTESTTNSPVREQRASFGIAVLFILSSLAVFAKAIFDLIRSNKPYHPYVLSGAASVSLVAYTGLAWAKYIISQKLHSKVMLADAINTLCVDLMAAMVLISLLVYKYTSTWYIGSIVAIFISLFLFIYGMRTIIKYSTSNVMRKQLK